MTLDEAREHIRDAVAYHAPDRTTRQGVIDHVSTQFVYVTYAGEDRPKGTHPAALTLLAASTGGKQP